MPTTSAGILLYRIRDDVVQVLIGHMGGPFWASKDAAAWSVPKGEYGDEDSLATARREFEEELGQAPRTWSSMIWGPSARPAERWCGFGPAEVTSTPRPLWQHLRARVATGIGPDHRIAEIDRAEWVDLAAARVRLVRGQVAALDELLRRLRAAGPDLTEGGASAGPS